MSVAALDDEIAELDAQIEKAQSEAATLGKRARQYADLSAELGKGRCKRTHSTRQSWQQRLRHPRTARSRPPRMEMAPNRVAPRLRSRFVKLARTRRSKWLRTRRSSATATCCPSSEPTWSKRSTRPRARSSPSRRRRRSNTAGSCSGARSFRGARGRLAPVGLRGARERPARAAPARRGVERLEVGEGELKVRVNPKEKSSTVLEGSGFNGLDAMLTKSYKNYSCMTLSDLNLNIK